MSLRLANDLRLPLDVLGESTAILAKKGAGKSNTAKVIVEEALDNGGVQVLALDPIGHWWGLRAGQDGKPRGGYEVAVFGGMHGDLPLEPTAGKLLAQTAVESGQSMVLDVSSLDSDGAMQKFAYEFAEELYRLKQARPTPALLVLEEADEFAPQDTRGPNVPRMVGAYNRIVKRGRGRGIGSLVVTQRSAALNKNVLDQSDTLIVMRTIGPRDRAAIEGWVKHQGAAGMEDVLPSLPSLKTGEAWVWTPERSLLQRVKVRKAKTFDTSRTPRPGEAELVVDVKPIDVKKLGEQIAATVQRSKENDPVELKRQLRERERELAEARTVAEAVKPTEVIVEVPVLDGQIPELEAAVNAMRDQANALDEHVGAILTKADRIIGAIHERRRQDEKEGRRASTATVRPRSTPGRADRPERTARPHRPEPRPDTAPAPEDGGALSAPEQKILDGLAWLEALNLHEGTKVQVAFLAGYTPSGGRFGNLIGGLRGRGLIDYPRTGLIVLTEPGRALAAYPEFQPTNEGLHEAVLARLDAPQGRILRFLLDAYPDARSREEVAEATSYEASGGRFGNLLGSLRSLGLIDYPATGYVGANAILFPEDA